MLPILSRIYLSEYNKIMQIATIIVVCIQLSTEIKPQRTQRKAESTERYLERPTLVQCLCEPAEGRRDNPQ